MSQTKSMLKIKFSSLRGNQLRRLLSTPSYFFLIWRWSMWCYALIIIAFVPSTYKNGQVYPTTVFLLLITFVQTLAVTLYAPVFQFLLPRSSLSNLLHWQQAPAGQQTEQNEKTDILPPLTRTKNPYWDMTIYGFDVLICGLVMYYSGPFNIAPDFGIGSPFYRYGISTVFAASLAYRYRGGLMAALGLEFFTVFGIFVGAPGIAHPRYHPNVIDITASLVDAPVIAILTGYIASLLERYASSKLAEENNVRREAALRRVSETIVRTAANKQQLLHKSAEQICEGGHFHAVILALSPLLPEHIPGNEDTEVEPVTIEITTSDFTLSSQSRSLLEQARGTGQKSTSTTYEVDGIDRLYLPIYKDGHIQLILGAESRGPLNDKDELFLSTAGAQLLVALDNIRLTEQTIQLAAVAERGRIAREIHDGIAQTVYMLSLNAETCSTQAQRIVEASEEDAALILPLAERLNKLVTISKQALWETRNYMFTLKPLMSGTTTLTQMLTNQVHEFEAISSLPVHLEIYGSEPAYTTENQQRMYRQARVGAAIFRIVQEALSNAYKHAGATELYVHLTYASDGITVEVRDNGHGITSSDTIYDEPRIYSGHGITGMRERAQELQGTLDIVPTSVGGVTVRSWIPYQSAKEQGEA